jgi:23S rRNA pseudouridine1911/1915/1917 synthase
VTSDLVILHEDNHLLVVDKPAGMLSQGDLTGDLDLLTLARETIKRRDGKPGNVYLGLVHRLDRPVSGVMVLAKTSKAAGRLSDQFRRRIPTKIYLAVVHGRPDPTAGRLEHRLVNDRAARMTRVDDSGAGGKTARLRYRTMEEGRDRSLVEVELETGLKHQIRVQLAAMGHAVLGDARYGAKERLPGRAIALHARSLTFEHPVRREPVTVTAETPAGWPWP